MLDLTKALRFKDNPTFMVELLSSDMGGEAPVLVRYKSEEWNANWHTLRFTASGKNPNHQYILINTKWVPEPGQDYLTVKLHPPRVLRQMYNPLMDDNDVKTGNSFSTFEEALKVKDKLLAVLAGAEVVAQC